MRKHQQHDGFTLIELSIVLVIIALLVAGVLVGKQMIDEARLRSIVTFHQQLRTAINTFRLKYNNVPGDLLQDRARSAGFSYCTNTDCGNGDGVLNIDPNFTTGYLPNDLIAEVPLFWRQLEESKLFLTSVEPGMALNAITGAPDVTPTTQEEVWLYTPRGEFGTTYFLSNYFGAERKVGMTVARVTTYADASYGAMLSPIQAFIIDTKIDNGIPNSGKVWSYCNEASPPSTMEDSWSELCETNDNSVQRCAFDAGGTYTYNTAGSAADLPSCVPVLAIPEIGG